MPNIFNETKAQGPVTFGAFNFYSKKTIQRSYNYLVRFDMSNTLENSLAKKLEYYHSTSVELPNYEFKKEEYRVGNFVKTFPVLDHNGFEFTIKLEEDDQGTISNFIDFLVHKNIGSDGYYKTLANTIIDRIVVDVQRSDGVVVYKHHFEKCYFLKASTPTYSYNTSDKIEYDITFNADHMFKEYRKASNDPDYLPSFVEEEDLH